MTRVIFLNGASSAGKTSIGTALQDLLPEPFLLLGLDTYFASAPARYGPTGPLRHRGFAYTDLPPDNGHPMVGITYGDIGWRIVAGFHRGLFEMVLGGNPVIIDEMLLDDRLRDDWLGLIAPLRPLLVGVYCDLAELTRREARRAGRPGLARWSAGRVHAGMRYDITVDTTNATPRQCAMRIASRLMERHAPPRSFADRLAS